MKINVDTKESCFYIMTINCEVPPGQQMITTINTRKRVIALTQLSSIYLQIIKTQKKTKPTLQPPELN